MSFTGHNIAIELRGMRSAPARESHDDALPGEMKSAQSMRFYTPIKLSEKISQTPEGFLICRDIAIANIGDMVYTAKEIPSITPDSSGIIRIKRDPDVLFHHDVLASFEGKPFTNDHPEDDVSPENWSELAKGMLQNVHRGADDLSDFMLGDLLVMDKDTIADILSGKREVSLGYDAEYEEISPGIGRQTSMVGNHIALVSRGRCGPRCAIRDRRPKMKFSIKDALTRAFKAKDAAELQRIVDEAEGGGAEGAAGGLQVHVHNYGEAGEKDKPLTVDERLAAAEKWINDRMTADKARDEEASAAEKKKAEEEAAAKTNDAGEGENLVEEEKTEAKKEGERTADAASGYAEVVARAEILAPGFKIPTLTKDAAADPQKTKDGLCICKRRALDAAMKIDTSKEVVSKFLNVRDGATVDKLTCDRVDAVFIGASEVLKAANNAKAKVKDGATVDTKTVDAFARGGMDKINQAFWDKQRNQMQK